MTETEQKQIFIKDLQVGSFPKYTTLTVRVKSKHSAANGQGYFGTFEDSTGVINYRVWEEVPFNTNDRVELWKLFKIGEYQGKLELNMGNFYKINVIKE